MNEERLSTNFPAWLAQRIAAKEWKPADLARQLTMPQQTVSQWLDGENLPEFNSCVKLAKALGLPWVDVLIAAGRLPEEETIAAMLHKTGWEAALRAHYPPHLAEEFIAVIHTIGRFHHADPPSARIASPAPDPQPPGLPVDLSSPHDAFFSGPQSKTQEHKDRALRKVQEDAEQEGGDDAEPAGGNGDP